MESRAMADLVVVVSQRVWRILQQRRQSGLPLHQRQSHQIFPVQKQQVEEEEDQRPFAGVGRVLDQVKCRPAIGQHPTKFAVEIGVPRRKPSYRLCNGRVFIGPVITPPRQDLHSASVEPGVHPIPIELDLVQPVGAVRCFFNELGELRLDPSRRWGRFNLSAGCGGVRRVRATGFRHATSRSSLLLCAAYNISKMSYRTIFGGSLSPTPTAKILLSQAYRSAPVSNIGATRK